MKKRNHIIAGIALTIIGCLIIFFANDFFLLMRRGLPGYTAEKDLQKVLHKAIAANDIEICNELPLAREILTSDGKIESQKARGTVYDCRQQFADKIQ